MTRIARIAPFVGLLVVLTGCPDPYRPFTITLAPIPGSAMPSGGVFSTVQWFGYVSNGNETITLTPLVIYSEMASFSYGSAEVGNGFHVTVTALYRVPNLQDPTNPTVYQVWGHQDWDITDAMNGGIPMAFAIPVYDRDRKN